MNQINKKTLDNINIKEIIGYYVKISHNLFYYQRWCVIDNPLIASRMIKRKMKEEYGKSVKYREESHISRILRKNGYTYKKVQKENRYQKVHKVINIYRTKKNLNKK